MAARTTPIAPIPASTFTEAEWQTLRALQMRYQQDHDHFSERERARLQFVRWLYQTGRLRP
jgi:hypothetical protein